MQLEASGAGKRCSSDWRTDTLPPATAKAAIRNE